MKLNPIRAACFGEQLPDLADVLSVPHLAWNDQRHGDFARLHQGNIGLGQIQQVTVTREARDRKNIRWLDPQALAQQCGGTGRGSMEAFRHTGIADDDFIRGQVKTLDQEIFLPIGNSDDFVAAAKGELRHYPY